MDESRDPDATGVDWAGLVTFSGSLFLLVFALVQGNENGWGSTEILALLLGRGSAVRRCSCIVEHAQERPMLDLSLFRRPAFAGASLVAFAIAASAFSMFLYLTLYIQTCSATPRYRPACASCRSTLLLFAVAPARRPAERAHARCGCCSALACCSSGAGLLAMTAVTPAPAGRR